jgi:predicted AAA+ superfamily ATPase
MKFGSLPKIFSLKDPSEKMDYLRAYSQTYIKEEIQQEALVRNLPNYIRFLKHLALNNGNVLNLSNISREAGIPRAPLENYMSIILDTLMGTILEPIHLKAKIKEVSNPKFYFFDCGIAEALSGYLGEPLAERVGNLFETLVLNELRSFSDYSKKHFEIHYWGTPSDNEVDFILSKGKIKIGIEVKHSKKWRPEFSKGLNVLLDAKKIQKALLVFQGEHPEIQGNIQAMPFSVFCNKLYAGEII